MVSNQRNIDKLVDQIVKWVFKYLQKGGLQEIFENHIIQKA